MTDVYEKLAQHLDNLPSGFPRTESGVEMRILRRLFSPEEAKLATCLTMIPEPTAGIAARLEAEGFIRERVDQRRNYLVSLEEVIASGYVNKEIILLAAREILASSSSMSSLARSMV